MKKNANILKTINIAVVSVLVLALAGILLSVSGIFYYNPDVEIKPDNCYEDTLYVITDADYMPYSFYDDAGNYSGHDVEFIALVANELQMNLDLKFMPWYEAIKAISEGQADVLMTCDYSDSFEGVDSLMKTEPVSTDEFIVYSKNEIKTTDELYSMKCAVMDNGNVLPQVRILHLEDRCLKYHDNRAAMEALENGDADCAIMRYTVGEALLKELGYIDIEGYVSIGQSYMCFGIANNNQELADRINDAIETLKVNGEVQKLHDKWLTSFIHTPTLREFITTNARIIIGAILLLLLLMTLTIRNQLKKFSAEEEKNRYIEIVENLANDFECVNYVNLQDKQDDETVLIRISDNLKRVLPEWSVEKHFTRRLELLNDGIVAPEDREKFARATERENVLRHLDDEGAYFVNFKAVIDGEPKYYQLKFSSVDDSRGKGKSIVCGLHNVDEETKREIAANEALQTALENEKISERKLEEEKILLDYFIDAYSTAYSINLENDTFEILRMNHDFADIFAFQGGKDEMIRFINEHIHPEDRAMMMRMIDKDYVTGRLKTEDNYTFTVREIFAGTERTIRCLVIKGTDVMHIAVGFMDISEELEKEKEIQRMLEAANKSKSDFLFNMSHDIRTPMNAITGFTELASKHIDDRDKVTDYLSKISNSSNHLLNLINEVLDMSRVESGKLTSEMKAVNIRDEAAQMISICRETANSRNIRLTLILDDIIHENVYADVLHVNRIITNILGNSIKYTMPGGNVIYTITELESENPEYGRYEFVIEDNGIGMTKEFLETIFDSFSREESAEVHEIQGTGLGMSIVKRLVDYLDGTIDIESAKGAGTKVTVILSMKIAGSAASAVTAADIDIDLSGKKALLVEDNELNREIACEILNEQGILVDIAVNGKEAVSIVKNKGAGYYDFVLMDIQMPFMNGYEATAAIRKMPEFENLTIIALSANAFEEDRQKSLDSGMNGHIAKPIIVKDLIEAIAHAIQP